MNVQRSHTDEELLIGMAAFTHFLETGEPSMGNVVFVKIYNYIEQLRDLDLRIRKILNNSK